MKRRTSIVMHTGQLGNALVESLQLSVADAGALVAAGAVYVDGKRARTVEQSVTEGQQLMAVLEESGRAAVQKVVSAPLKVLHDDARLIAVDKPPGVLAQPGPSGGTNLVELVSVLLHGPAGLVHRLDRETSGVTVFGKTKAATSELAALFREGQAKKRYVAVVTAELPPSGEIDLPLSRDPSRPGRWRATRAANGITALTRFEVLQSKHGRTVVALFPETGRTHQLRAHLTALHAPIAGDALYGGAKEAPRCLLHAQRLTLEGLVIEAPLPDDLRTFADI